MYENEFIVSTLTETEKVDLRGEFYLRMARITAMSRVYRTVNLISLLGELNVLTGFGVFSPERSKNLNDDILNMIDFDLIHE